MLHSELVKRGAKFAMNASRQSESTDFDWAVRLHRVLLKACGIWPEIYESPRKKLLVHLYSLMGVLVFLIFVILPGLNALYHSRHDMFAVVDNLQVTVSMIGVFVKYLDVWAGKEALIAVTQGIAEDWAKPRNSREQEVMVSQAKLGRTIFKVTVVLIGAPTTLFFILPLLGVKINYDQDPKNRPLVIPSRFIFDVSVSPNYELTYFAQICGVAFSGMVYNAVDNFIVFFILHIRGQLRNLRSRILLIGRSTTFRSDLVVIVKDHIRLTSTITVVDSIFGRTFAGVLLYFTITICMNTLIILYMLQMDDNIPLSQVLVSITILTASFVHSVLYCVMGEILVVELEKIYNAVCTCEWEHLKPSDARNLLIVMIHSNRPINLTAAKIVPMNMITFCAMLRMAGGYVSFLLAQLQ